MNNTTDNTYLHYLHNVITNIPKTDVDNKNQKRYDILLSILILAPIFIAPTIIAFGYTMIGIAILVVCYSLVAIIGINKRKNITRRFYKVKNAYKNIRLNNISDKKTINQLYDNSALTFITNPSNELFDFIYNWLNNNNLLKEEKLNIYMFNGKALKDKFNYKEINEEIVFLCIFLKDLDLNNSNLKQFSKERYAAGVNYLDEIIKKPKTNEIGEDEVNYKKIIEHKENMLDSMYYDEALENYVIEIRNIVFTNGEEQGIEYIKKMNKIADNYYNNLDYIIEFMLPDLKSFYDDIDEKSIKEKLGKPIIDYDNGIVQYLEHSFDNTHIFTFEFLDDEFKELQYFAIDG